MTGDTPEIPYRSMSFHRAIIPNKEIVRRGAELGFNDMTFQTEGGAIYDGGPIEKFREFRNWATEDGYFELADELDMTMTIWATELDAYDRSWGPITLENDELWRRLDQRYEKILTDVLPEIDYLALKATESRYQFPDSRLLTRLIDIVNHWCRETDTRLILRPFTWHPDEHRMVIDAIEDLPDDVIIQNKNWPQDWHQRSIDNPYIGTFDGHDEFVEVDFANEYAYLGNLSNITSDIVERQFEDWVEAGVSGVAARVTRQPATQNLPPEEQMFDILDHPNEANLWVLGYLLTGRETADAWQEYAEATYGEDVADTIIEIFKSTEQVVSEGLCVEKLHFGRTKWNGVLFSEEGNIPANMTFRGRWHNSALATKNSDEVAESRLLGNPYARKGSRWRWDEDYVPKYHAIRKGEDDVITSKKRAYEEALETADRSLKLLTSIEDDLSEDAYEYLRFRLEENRFHLVAKCEMQLAWLKESNRMYSEKPQEEQEELRSEVLEHLHNVNKLTDRYNETITVKWGGETKELRGGGSERVYIDIPGYLHEFRRYWQLDECYDSFTVD